MNRKGNLIYEIPQKLFESNKTKEKRYAVFFLFIVPFFWLLTIYTYLTTPEHLWKAIASAILVSIFIIPMMSITLIRIKSWEKFQIYDLGITYDWKGILLPFSDIDYAKICWSTKEGELYLQIVRNDGKIERLNDYDCGNIKEVIRILSEHIKIKHDACPICRRQFVIEETRILNDQKSLLLKCPKCRIKFEHELINIDT